MTGLFLMLGATGAILIYYWLCAVRPASVPSNREEDVPSNREENNRIIIKYAYAFGLIGKSFLGVNFYLPNASGGLAYYDILEELLLRFSRVGFSSHTFRNRRYYHCVLVLDAVARDLQDIEGDV